jgi:hypothetical protein
MVRVVVMVVMVAGCFSADTHECGDIICPSNKACVAGTCALPEQLTACEDKADGADCTFAGAAAGRCSSGVCLAIGCGDHRIDYPEECEPDDLAGATCESLGFQSGTLACGPRCVFDTTGCAGYCGDGIRNGDEQCDPGDAQHPTVDLAGADCTSFNYYEAGGLACNEICKFDTSACTGYCGDHVINGTELCDGAPPAGTSCTDYGFDVGSIGCAFCAPDLSACGKLGWIPIATTTSADLSAVWTTGRDNVWAVGRGGAVVHYDGRQAQTVGIGTTADLLAVEGSSPSDVYIAGYSGAFAHFDGTAWTPINTASFPTNAIGGLLALAANDAYAFCAFGIIMHFDGATWSRMTTPTSQHLHAAWASGPSDIWVTGDSATVLHYDGATWSSVANPLTSVQDVIAIAPFGGDLYFGLWNQDGGLHDVAVLSNGTWTVPQSTSFGNNLVPGLASDHATLVAVNGYNPYVLAPDRAGWVTMEQQAPAALSAAAADPVGHIWAAGNAGTLLQYSGTSWITLQATRTVTGLWGSDARDVWIALGTQCMHYTGGGIFPNAATAPTCTTKPIQALWGTSAMNIFGAQRSGSIVRYNGASWTESTVDPAMHDLNAIGGSSASDLYAVGAAGTVLHSTDGMTWTSPLASPPSEALYGVFAPDATHAFIVGAAGRVVSLVGTSWTSSTAGSGAALYAVWGTSASDVWAVGAGGQILHFDGAAWSTVASPTALALRSLWGTATNDVFAAGDGGTVLHFDGTAWGIVRIPDATGASITTTWGSGRYVFFANLMALERSGYPASGCAAKETACNDALDDDCDFLLDCADPDCRADPVCN